MLGAPTIDASVQHEPHPEKQMRRPLILAILAALVGAFHMPADAVVKCACGIRAVADAAE